MKSRVFVKLMVLVFWCFLIALVFSTNGEKALGSDLRILGMEVGTCFVFNVDTDDIGPAQYFSINLPVSDNLVGGFTLIDGDGVTALDYSLLRLSYFIGQKKPMGVDLYVGGGGALPNLAGGVGFFINVLGKELEEAVSTALKFKAAYILTETANESGSFILTLTGQFGL
jgi:hypothetical protein